jgi:hypothetical protein
MTNCAEAARRPDEQRLFDVASILAAGILRLRERQPLGCWSWPPICASSMNRRTTSGRWEYFSSSTLTARSRPKSTSWPRMMSARVQRVLLTRREQFFSPRRNASELTH